MQMVYGPYKWHVKRAFRERNLHIANLANGALQPQHSKRHRFFCLYFSNDFIGFNGPRKGLLSAQHDTFLWDGSGRPGIALNAFSRTYILFQIPTQILLLNNLFSLSVWGERRCVWFCILLSRQCRKSVWKKATNKPLNKVVHVCRF